MEIFEMSKHAAYEAACDAFGSARGISVWGNLEAGRLIISLPCGRISVPFYGYDMPTVMYDRVYAAVKEAGLEVKVIG